MSGSDRGLLTALGLAFCVLLAAGGAFRLYSSASTSQASYERTAEDRAHDYSQRRDVIIEDRCLPLAGSKQADCINEEREAARQGYRDEYDLEAQRITAVWTAHMGIAAIIGMAASLIGVGLVWTTFRETRKAANISERTYKAFIAMERPRLVVKFGEVKRYAGGRIGFDLSVTNIGKSSCVVTKGLWASRKTNEFGEVKGYLGNPLHILVDVADTERVARIYANANTVDETPYFGGMVVYQSAMAEMHRTHFCRQFIKENSDPRCKIHGRDMRPGDWPKDD